MTREILEDSTVDKDGNVTKHNKRYASLRSEIQKQIGVVFTDFTLTSLGGVYPTDIDDFNARFDPDAVLDKHLKDAGVTAEEIKALPLAVRKSFELCLIITMNAIMFGHGKPPGMPNEDAFREGPIL